MGDVEFEKRVEEEALKTDARLCEYRAWGPSRAMVEAVRPLVERLAAAEADRDGLRVSLAAAENERGRCASQRDDYRASWETVRAELARETEARRAAEAEAVTWKARADQLLESLAAGKVRAALGAAPEESALEAAERTARALNEAESERDEAREAHRAVVKDGNALRARIRDLEARIIALDTEVRAARDETRRAWVRVVAAEDERDRQAEHGAKLADQLEGMTGERDEALSLVRRYRVQLAEVVGREAALRAALADYRAGLRALARDLLGVEVDGRRVEEVGS